MAFKTSTTASKMGTETEPAYTPPWGGVRIACLVLLLAYIHSLLNIFPNILANLHQRFAQILKVRYLSTLLFLQQQYSSFNLT